MTRKCLIMFANEIIIAIMLEVAINGILTNSRILR